MQNRLVAMADRKSTDSALRDTAEQFHILVDSVEEYALYMLDPSGNVVTWNRGAEKIKGYKAAESSARTLPASIRQRTLPRTSPSAICPKPRGADIFAIRGCASARMDPLLKPKWC